MICGSQKLAKKKSFSGLVLYVQSQSGAYAVKLKLRGHRA